MPRTKRGDQNLGRAIARSRGQGRRKRNRKADAQHIHTTELPDGRDKNMQSITEHNSLQEFLDVAVLAGTQFDAEHESTVVLENSAFMMVEADIEREIVLNERQQNAIRIPRRPDWDSFMTADELDKRERESFLQWRRDIAKEEEQEMEQKSSSVRYNPLLMTPFEKNIEVWRQLWRVVEKSQLIVQIIDARNPLLFYCEDLPRYTTEVSDRFAVKFGKPTACDDPASDILDARAVTKRTMVVMNKSDLLTDGQRRYWKEHFESISVDVCFFSAVEEQKRLEALKLMEKRDLLHSGSKSEGESYTAGDAEKDDEEDSKSTEELHYDATKGSQEAPRSDTKGIQENSLEFGDTRVLTTEELIAKFKEYKPNEITEEQFVVGMVGYPNVGKSSTINALCAGKKVAESATPGKTKHFQTLHLPTSGIVLCDCPGLVFPSFVATKADMVCNGLLPIDQLRDVIEPTNLVTARIPRAVLEYKYGIQLPRPSPNEPKDRPPSGHELLRAYGAIRGFMTSHGQPDESRAGRIVLKDFVKGSLVYCHPPPGVSKEDFTRDVTLPEAAMERHNNISMDTTNSIDTQDKSGSAITGDTMLPEEIEHQRAVDRTGPIRAQPKGKKTKRRAAEAKRLEKKAGKMYVGAMTKGKYGGAFTGRVEREATTSNGPKGI